MLGRVATIFTRTPPRTGLRAVCRWVILVVCACSSRSDAQEEGPRRTWGVRQVEQCRSSESFAEFRIVASPGRVRLVWLACTESGRALESSVLFSCTLDRTGNAIEGAERVSPPEFLVADPQLSGVDPCVTLSYKLIRGVVVRRLDESRGSFCESVAPAQEGDLPPLFDYPVHQAMSPDSVLLFANRYGPSLRVPVMHLTPETCAQFGEVSTNGTALEGHRFRIFGCHRDEQSKNLWLTGESLTGKTHRAFHLELDTNLQPVRAVHFEAAYRVRRGGLLPNTDSRLPPLSPLDGPFQDANGVMLAMIWIAALGNEEEGVVACTRSVRGVWEGPVVLRKASRNSLFLPAVSVSPDDSACFSWVESTGADEYSLKYCLAGTIQEGGGVPVHEVASGLSFPQFPGFSRQSAWSADGTLFLGWCGGWRGERGIFVARSRSGIR